MTRYFKLPLISIILSLVSPLVYGSLCSESALSNFEIRESHKIQLNALEAQILRRIEDLPTAKQFVLLDHREAVQFVKSTMPKLMPNVNSESLPEVVFVKSLQEFYKLRFKNVSVHLSKSTGGDRSEDALNFVTQDTAFYDPYTNRVVVNLYSFSTFLNFISKSMEPTLEQYTAALKIFLSHEFTHGVQEKSLQLVSKMLSGGASQAQLSRYLEGHAIYVQELFAKHIDAKGFLLNMHQQAHELSGFKSRNLEEILNLKLAFERNHDSAREKFWEKFLLDFGSTYRRRVLEDISISKLTKVGAAEEEIVRAIWSEGRKDEFTRPLKMFDPHLTADGAGAERYRQIIEEVAKVKEGHLDTNIRFIFKGAEVVGFFRVVETEESVELDQLYVLRKMRGKGIGTIVMNHLIEKFGNVPIELYVLKDNPAAKFYQRFGFEIVESLEITKGYEFVPQLPVYRMVRSSLPYLQ